MTADAVINRLASRLKSMVREDATDDEKQVLADTVDFMAHCFSRLTKIEGHLEMIAKAQISVARQATGTDPLS